MVQKIGLKLVSIFPTLICNNNQTHLPSSSSRGIPAAFQEQTKPAHPNCFWVQLVAKEPVQMTANALPEQLAEPPRSARTWRQLGNCPTAPNVPLTSVHPGKTKSVMETPSSGQKPLCSHDPPCDSIQSHTDTLTGVLTQQDGSRFWSNLSF